MDTRGDDLDDDFVPDDLVALSEDEDVAHSAEADDIGGLLSADEGGVGEAGPSQLSQVALDKKRKRRQKEKERKAKKVKLAQTAAPIEQPSPAAQPPMLLVDYISSMQAKSFSKMSGIELADIQIPGRELHSRHDNVDGIEKFGSARGFHIEDASHTTYTFIAEAQIQRGANSDFHSWSGFTSG